MKETAAGDRLPTPNVLAGRISMRVLAINCGSSTLKWQLREVGRDAQATLPAAWLAGGGIEAIGGQAAIDFEARGGARLHQQAAVADHGEATRHALDWLRSTGLLGEDGVDAVGHRVVHGGERFSAPVRIDEEVIAAIEALANLAPLHNAPALAGISAVRTALGSAMPMVATFDTAFHHALPERAALYAIPLELSARHAVRRYGFHGLAHRFMMERYAAIAARSVQSLKLVTFQLGNGCSATAIAGGRSVDTSMGFTPLEGLIMGTRSGDVDPSLAGYLARREGVGVAEVEGWLNRRSGLLGLSGRSGDMRELLAAERDGDERAALAIEAFCYRARKYLGAYLAALGGADAVIFGGGIGENAPAIRARICADMDWSGILIDPERNEGAVGVEARIGAQRSRIDLYVVPVDEAAIIAQDTARCLLRATDG